MNRSGQTETFITFAAHKLTEQLAQVERCAALLNAEQLWRRTNDHTNSVGNLLLHLAGNVRQWLCAGLTGAPAERDRPAEFAARGPAPAPQLTARLRDAVTEGLANVRRLDEAALLRPLTIQTYVVTPLIAVFHVVEHFSFHTGQIVHITKALLDVDLSLYDAQGHRAAPLP